MTYYSIKKAMAAMLAGLMIFGAAPAASLAGAELSSLSFTSVRASAAGITSADGLFDYNLNNNRAEIIKCKDTSASEIIINNVDGHPVSVIGGNAFSDCKLLEKVTIGVSVSSVNSNAFDGCVKLSEVVFAPGRTADQKLTIGDKAFDGCGSSTSVSEFKINLEDSNATRLGRFLFSGLKIKSVIIPDTCTSTGGSVFTNCARLETVKLSENLTSLYNWNGGFFAGCTSLKKITIPAAVASIDSYTFNGCEKLEEVVFERRNDEQKLTIGKNAFANCDSLGYADFYGEKSQWDSYTISDTKISNPLRIENYGDSIRLMFKDSAAPAIYTITYNANGGSGAPSAQSGNGSITLSGVKPVRDGYKFLGWAQSRGAASAQYQPGASYSLSSDIILYAVWQKDAAPVNPGNPEPQVTPVNPTAGAVINVRSSASVSYKTKVSLTATADNVPSGYYLVIYEGGSQRAKGDNKTVTYDAGEMRDSTTFTVKVVDGLNRVQKDSSGRDLSRDCEIKVNSSFFARLIAFFRSLLGRAPQAEIKP